MRQSKKKLPLRVYLSIGFLIFSALLLAVLWTFQTVFLETFYKSVKTGQVKACADSVADNIESSSLSDLISDIEDQNSMKVAIFNTESSIFTTVYSSESNPFLRYKLEMSEVYELYNCASEKGGEYSTVTRTGNERRFDARKEGESFSGETFVPWDKGGLFGAEKGEGDFGAGTDPDRSSGEAPAGEEGSAQTSPTSPHPDKNGEAQAPTEADRKNTDQNENNDSGNPQGGASDTVSAATNTAVKFNIETIAAEDNTEADISGNSDGGAAVPDNIREPSLERENVETLAYVRILDTSAGERLIIVESEITPVTSVVDTLRYQLIIMTVVLIVLSVIVAIFVANMIAKPISDANEKAKALANRDYDLHFSGGRYREIKELNDTLTYAAGELQKVDNLQKELIANISHDLRTPLTMITGYSEIMRDLPGEANPENIQIIIDEANRLNSLVSDLLDISRLQSGTADIKRAPFSLTNCILSIFSRYTKLIESDGLNIVFEHEGEVFVNGDELRMTQVLYNLINNAINYIGDDKTVVVRQTVKDKTVRIDVIDHGEGIPREKLEYIWDRYYRVDKEHKRAVIGTGLGLSIVKNILIAHDADFGVASKLGEGSDFYFSMPVIEQITEK